MFHCESLTQNFCFLTDQLSLDYHQQTLVDWTRYTKIFVGSYYSCSNNLFYAVADATTIHAGMRSVNASMLVSPALLIDTSLAELRVPYYKVSIRRSTQDGLGQSSPSTLCTQAKGHGVTLTTFWQLQIFLASYPYLLTPNLLTFKW